MTKEVQRKKDTSEMSEASTEQIMNQIRTSPGMFAAHELDTIQDAQFIEYLKELMEKYHCAPGQLIIRTCLSKPFVYQILKGKRLPGRDMILRICLAMRAETEETQKLLTLAGKGVLYPKIRRDAAILCCIEAKKSLDYTNLFLREHGEKELL